MKHQNFNAANCITALRIAGTLGLLLMQPLSVAFFIIYTLTGLTDVLDGYIARKTNSVSELGAKLDSIADLLFCGVTLIRIFPMLRAELPAEIWYALAGILLLRLAAYLTAAVKYHKFISLHTYMNKLTGGAVFLIPYVLSHPAAVPVCWVACGIAAAAAAEELLLHLCRRTCQTDTKSILMKEC